ncbi:uncharacterized protein [Cicer arietinum]|uniref:uncharacterized protein n=1 Tax=Cicer arietinum TaxID=3827 RepID=UPI003CC689BB
MEVLKDCDCTILYHLGKANVVANVVANALSSKSRGSITYIAEVKRSIVKAFQEIVESGIQFEHGHSRLFLAHVQIHPTIVDDIKEAQSQDSYLVNMVNNVQNGKISDFSVDFDGVLRLKSQLCVANVGGLRRQILEEAHHSSYTIHPGLPRIQKRYDSVWVIIDRLTKYAHIFPMKTTYTTSQYAKLYLYEIVSLHGVLMSIIYYRGAQFLLNFGSRSKLH